MNRFLSKRKAPKGRRSPDLDKAPTFDLKSVLPTNDDFRTSLIMPNLSARFSMLREQDDPATKIGKASDDSVLYPKRQSRFPDFGFAGVGGLGDISEVDSLKSSTTHTRGGGRRDSGDGSVSYAVSTDNPSVMDRARPVEGNNLFGGRQKVYKIPTSTSVKSLGRLVYAGDDMSVSSHQKYREERTADDRGHLRAAVEPLDPSTVGLATTTPEPQRKHTHELSFEQRRPSFGSSNVSDAVYEPIWTPATSISSQPRTSPGANAFVPKPKDPTAEKPLDRSLTKRRMYEQTLDQNRQEQQISALTRLNSLHQQRVQGGNRTRPANLPLHTSTSHGDNKLGQALARPLSPTEQLTTFDSIARSASPVDSRPQSPSFFPIGDEMNMLATTLQPSDRGKATAMGAFHMPTQQFDEEQYLRRLQQLQGGGSPRDDQVEESDAFKLTRYDSANQSPVEGHGVRGRRSRPTSPPEQNSAANPFAVFQYAAAQNRSNHNSPEIRQGSTFPDTHRTFFGDINASDDEDEASTVGEYDRREYASHPASRFKPTDLEGIEEHPDARYDGPVLGDTEDETNATAGRESYVPHPSPLRIQTQRGQQQGSSQSQDSQGVPASGPQDGFQRALGGLIHQHLRSHSNVSSDAPSIAARNIDNRHLRNLSNQSSVYTSGPGGPEDSIPDFANASQTTWGHLEPHDAVNVDHNHRSNPWDLDDLDRDDHYRTADKRVLEPENARRQGPRDRVPATSTSTTTDHNSQRSSQASNWQPDHRRELSDGTVQEREAFANELAARQKAIQENLRSIVEVDSETTTPQQAREFPFKKTNSDGETSAVDLVHETTSNKAMKMLGIPTNMAAPVSAAAQGSKEANDTRSPPAIVSTDSDKVMPASRRSPGLGPGPRGFQNMQRSGGQNPPQGPGARGFQDIQRSGGQTLPIVAGPRAPQNMQHPDGRNPPFAAGPRAPQDMQHPSGQNQPSGPGRQMPPPMAGRPFHSPSAYANYSGYGDDRQQPRVDSPREQSFVPTDTKRSPVIDRQYAMQQGPLRSLQTTPQHSPVLAQDSMTSPHTNRLRSNSRTAVSSPTEYHGFAPRSGQPSPASAPSSATFKYHGDHGPHGPRSAPLQRHVGQTEPVSASTTPAVPSQTPLIMPPIPNIKAGGVLRKRAVQKHEISEPTLISSTSNVDTVDLPSGASLRNGMETPPVELVNPRKKRGPGLFGGSKKDDAARETRHVMSSRPFRALHSQYPSPSAPPPIPMSATSPRMAQSEGSRTSNDSSHASSTRSPVQGGEVFDRIARPGPHQPMMPRTMTEGGMF